MRGCVCVTDDTELFLLIASRRSVVKSNLELWLFDQLPMASFQSLTAIDMDVRRGNIFFSDTSLKKIYRASYNGTNLVEVSVSMVQTSLGWVSKRYKTSIVVDRDEQLRSMYTQPAHI